jgi:hypothetical protein
MPRCLPQVDFEEFAKWWAASKAAGGGGLFGGLFANPLELSDGYLSMQIKIQRTEERAVQRAGEADRLQVQLGASLSLSAHLH